MKLKQALFTVLGAGLVAGCGSGASNYQPKLVAKIDPATVRPGEEAKLFPLEVGNQWTYDIDVQTFNNGQLVNHQNAQNTWKVVSVQPISGGTRATLEISSQGRVDQKEQWTSTDKGIFQVASGKTDLKQYSSLQPVIVFPVKDGGTFSWKGSSDVAKQLVAQVDSTIRPPQEVDTGIGRVSAIPVESRVNFKTSKGVGKGSTIVWLAPKTGIVRLHREISGSAGVQITTLTLKSKSLKGS